MTEKMVDSKERSNVNEIKSTENESDPLVRTSNVEKNTSICTILQFSCFVVMILAVVQYAYGVLNHSSLMKMQFAGSILVFVSSIEYIYSKKSRRLDSEKQGIFLLYRTAATVFYIACLFLNLTHCLEEITDLHHMEDAVALSAENVTLPTSNEDIFVITEETLVEEPWINLGMQDCTLIISLADLFVKFIYIFAFDVLSVNVYVSFIPLVFPSIFTLGVYAYTITESHFLTEWIDHHIEPLLAIALTVLCIGVAIFSLIRKKQYLLAEGPKNFDIEKISSSVMAKNQNLERIDHVHASCEWPQGFIVSLKAYIKVEKTNKDWVSQAADDFDQLKTLLHSEIKAAGAKEVIVEPVFVDHNESATFVDTICIDPSCHNENVGCCTNPKPSSSAALA